MSLRRQLALWRQAGRSLISPVWRPVKQCLARAAKELNVFPCPLCHTGDGRGNNFFCDDCLAKLPVYRGKRCPGCGGELDGIMAVCSQCTEAPPRLWAGAVSLFEYRGEAKKLIHAFKFNNRPELARPLGYLGAQLLKEADFPVDVIVPVPLHFLRRYQRSFNQSELIAGELGRHLGLPVADVLRRTRHTPSQASLKRKERLKNQKNAFTVSDAAPLQGKTVLLVDDVLTTGSTLNATARALLKHDVSQIYVFTLGRPLSYARRKPFTAPATPHPAISSPDTTSK